MEKPGSKSLAKKVLKFFLLGGIVFLIILAALSFGLRLYFDDEKLREISTSMASEYLNAELLISDLNISVFSSIALDSVYVVDGNDTLLGCSSIKVDYSLSKILSRELQIIGMTLDDPVVSLKTKPDGEIDLSWLNIPDDSLTEETVTDTSASAELPISVKLNDFNINNAAISLTGAQSVFLDGLYLSASEMEIMSIDSISGRMKIRSFEPDGIDFAYSYFDTLGEISAVANLNLDVSLEISPGNEIEGAVFSELKPIRISAYDYEYQSDFLFGSDLSFSMDSGELAISSIETEINGNELLKADFGMRISECDTLFPIELSVSSAQIDFSEFQPLIESLMPGTALSGRVRASNIQVNSGPEFPGMNTAGKITLENICLANSEYGYELRNLSLSSNFKGALFGIDAGYDFDMIGGADSIFYALDETTAVVIPSTSLKFDGALDSLYQPVSINGLISLNGLFGDTLASDIKIDNGIPPQGTIELSITLPEAQLNAVPYMEYEGKWAVEIHASSRNDRINITGKASISEVMLLFEEDNLFIPEMVFNLGADISCSEDFLRYNLVNFNLDSEDYFTCTGSGELAMGETSKFNTELDAAVYHHLLEDFIPTKLRDSLGVVEFSGESEMELGIQAVMDERGETEIRAEGKLNSAIDTLSVELYAFTAINTELTTDFTYVDDRFSGKTQFSNERLALEDTLLLPLRGISGETSFGYYDSTFTWNDALLDINSHKLELKARGSYLVSDNPTMTLSSNIEFRAADTIEVMKGVGMTGRFDGSMEISMDDSLMNLRGYFNPILLSVISPEFFTIQSISGSVPFEQSISLANMRLLGDVDYFPELNILNYEQEKYFKRIGSEGNINFRRLTAGRIHIDDFSMILEINQGQIICRRLYSGIYGGNLLGDFYLDLRGLDFAAEVMEMDSLRYAANFQASGINFDRLAGSDKVSERAVISGDLSLVGRGIVDPESDFELEGQVNITKIGPRATKKLLDFLDPTGSDISIAETRKLMDRRLLFLDISYQPKSLSMKIKHGNINPSIDMDQPFFAKYLRIGAVTMPVEYDRKQLDAMLKAAAATPIEEE